MEVDQAQPLAHGFPGTPVTYLFHLDNLAFGDGSRPRGSLCPIRAGEFRSHSARKEPNVNGPQKPRENRGRNSAMGNDSLGQSIRMIGQFLHVRQCDSEAMATRVTSGLEESTAATVRQQ